MLRNGNYDTERSFIMKEKLETLARKLIFYEVEEVKKTSNKGLVLCGVPILSFSEMLQLDSMCATLRVLPYYMTVGQAFEIIKIYGSALALIKITQAKLWWIGLHTTNEAEGS